MSAITAEMIKNLRERTGVAMGKCKEALEHSKGDMELAIEFLRKAGVASAVKKESRATNEGRIEYAENDKTVALVEMNAETDFVVKNEMFAAFHKEIVKIAADKKPANLEAFLAEKMTSIAERTIDEGRRHLISVLGENINISRVLCLPKQSGTSLGIYSHMNGKILTIVEIQGATDQVDFAKEIAMHVAAEAPDYLKPEDVPANVRAKEEEIAKSQLPEGKPGPVVDKIFQGKMEAYYNQACLLNQKYVKDQALTISGLLAKRSKEIGKNITISRFVRWYVGGQ